MQSADVPRMTPLENVALTSRDRRAEPTKVASRNKPSPSAKSNKPPRTHTPISFHFINTRHPSQAKRSDTIRTIRSHVAKDNHARARRDRGARLEIQVIAPWRNQAAAGSTQGSHRRNCEENVRDSQDIATEAIGGRSHGERLGNQLVAQALLVPCAPPHTDEEGSAPPCSPLNVLASNRRNPFQTYGRDVTEVEHLLIDHCEWTLPEIEPFLASCFVAVLSFLAVS